MSSYVHGERQMDLRLMHVALYNTYGIQPVIHTFVGETFQCTMYQRKTLTPRGLFHGHSGHETTAPPAGTCVSQEPSHTLLLVK